MTTMRDVCPKASFEDDQGMPCAIGNDGVRAYMHSDTVVAIYLPRKTAYKSLRHKYPEITTHQEGDDECTLHVDVKYAKAHCKTVGIFTRGWQG